MPFVEKLVNFFTSSDGWTVHIFAVVLCVLVLDFVQRKVLRKLLIQAELKTKNIWDDALLHSAKRPVSLILWMVGLTVISRLVHRDDPDMAAVIAVVSHVGIIVAIAWFAAEFISFSQQKLIQAQLEKPEEDESRVDRVTIEALCKLLRLAVIITSGIVVLETLGFSISGILAFGGIGGIAVGFAAKDLLSNFFGGLMIYLDRPFSVGDWIRSNDRDIEGVVEYIGWRQTRIRTFSKRPIYVPNSVFSSIVVENPSRMHNRRIYETMGIRYDDIGVMDLVVADVLKMLQEHPEISEQDLMVNFNAFGSSSVDFFVYALTETTRWAKYHEVKQDVLLKISHIVASHNAEFAFPTSTLHLHQATKETRLGDDMGGKESPELAGLHSPTKN